MYHSYARVYDGSGQVRFALLMAPYLDEVLNRHPIVGQHALDLACGTGTLALELAERGWHVVGIDLAEAMIAHAQAKAQGAIVHGSVTFRVGDMCDLVNLLPASSVDLAICTFDSLNYLIEDGALQRCFCGVAHALRPGGIFLADMNTRYFLEHVWERCEINTYAGYDEIQQSWFDPHRAIITVHLTGFVGDDTHGYERFDETHRERAYSDAEILSSLHQARLYCEARYDCFSFTPPTAQTQRILWVIRRQDAAS